MDNIIDFIAYREQLKSQFFAVEDAIQEDLVEAIQALIQRLRKYPSIVYFPAPKVCSMLKTLI